MPTAILVLRQADAELAVEQWLQFGTQMLSRTPEAIAATIIALGILRALLAYLCALVFSPVHISQTVGQTESIRPGLGCTLGLGLEFLLAAGILSTAVGYERTRN